MPGISHEERAYLIDFITDLARKRGNPLLLSTLGMLIANDDRSVALRNAYGSLLSLVQTLAPEIRIETDARDAECLYVSALPRTTGGEAEDIVFDGYPMYINPDDALIESQINDMHQFAFMGWWNNIFKQLKRLTGYSGNDPHIWTCIIARQFAQARSRDELLYREFTNEYGVQTVCIFKTGLRTLDGKLIVAILVPNQGARQQWFFSEYTYAGNENGTYGMWLLDVLPESGDKESVMAELRTRVCWSLEMLNSIYPEIKPVLVRLADGYIPDDESLTRIREYLDKSAEFTRRVKILPEHSMDYKNKKISELLDESGASSTLAQIKKLNDSMLELLDPIEEVLRSILAQNTADNAHAIAKCRNFIAGTSAGVLAGGDPSMYLADYEEWVFLLGQLVRALWEGEIPQSDVLYTKFMIAPVMAGMLHDHLLKGDPEKNRSVLQKQEMVEENLSFFEKAVNDQQNILHQPVIDAEEEFSPEANEEETDEMDDQPALYEVVDELPDFDDWDFASGYMAEEYRPDTSGVDAEASGEEADEALALNDSENEPEQPGEQADEQIGIGKEQNKDSVAVFNQNIVDKCRDGELDAEMQLLRFGEWKDTNEAADYTGMSAKDIARKMLTSDGDRSEAGLVLCLNHSINLRRLQLSRWLQDSLRPGINKALYDIVVRMQNLFANEAVGDKAHMMNNIIERMRYVWNELENSEQKVCRMATVVIAAQIHHMIIRCFQIDTVRELLIAFNERKWLLEGSMMKPFGRLQQHMEDPNADPAFRNNHRDMSARLMAVNNLDNRISTLERLRSEGLRLKERFSNCGIRYGNARNVIRSFVTEKSERTLAMLDSLIQGRVLEGAVAFEDDDEMMDYANEQQNSFLTISNPEDIVGYARNAVLAYMGELNDAFCQLCAINTENAEISEQVLNWYRSIIADLKDCGHVVVAQLKNFGTENELINYLLSINAGNPLELTWNSDESKAQLYCECEDQNPWPLFSEDGRICALMELSGCVTDLTTLEMGSGHLLSENAQSSAKAIANLLRKCRELNTQLYDMKRFSTIDLEECGTLLDILDYSYGWLQRIQQQFDKGDYRSITLPLVRHEMEIWYVDQRIADIFGYVADSVKESIEQYAGSGSAAEYESMMQDIDEAAKRRDMNFITERFADVVSSIAYLDEKKNPASMFFDLNVMRALVAAIATENWGKEQLNQLDIEGYKELRATNAESKEIKTVGRAIEIADKYSEDKDSLTEQRLARIQDLFTFLGFADPRLTKQEDCLSLSVAIPDRSICPVPELGLGISMRDPGRNNAWCVNYQVRVMRNINELNTTVSSAYGWLNETVTILLCPFVISASERKALLETVREIVSSRNLFLLDKCFLRFAMCLRGTERLRAFYLCTSSLMKLHPYTCKTERQWEGTFFGREQEIQRVSSTGPDGCHVLYGGRRLGKTSIMREAEFRWLSSKENRIALYINLQLEGNSDGLWYKVARELCNIIPALSAFRSENVTEEAVNRDATRIIMCICEYLRSKESKLLLLLDECDELVYRDAIRSSNQERNRDTSRVSELVRLMDESQGRCKVVLAGLDRVTRFIRNLNAYNMALRDNSPSYQRFTESICIRPMLGSDMQNAYDLIDIPFKTMGYRMDRESILYILRVCCFRPNLIQNYCRALLEAARVRNAVRFEKNSLYMHIPYEMVKGIQESRNAVTDYHSTQAEQSISIPLNVGETAVYAPIAYAVALLSLRDSLKGLFTGFKPQEILAVIDSYNPDFTRGMPQSNNYISTILDELVYMGILRSINNPGSTTYALFSQYMMKMLGDNATIEAQLIDSLETHIARNRSSSEDIARRELFLERFIAEDSFVFPVTSAQLETLNLALKQSGYAVVIGSDMLRISDVNAMFSRIRIDNTTCEVRTFNAEQDDGDSIQRLVDYHDWCSSEQDKRIVLIVDGDWTKSMLDWAADREVQGNVSVVFLARPGICWQNTGMLMEIPEKNKILLSRVARSFRIGWFNWVNAKQRHRFGEDATTLRKLSERVGRATGDWPEMITRFRSLMLSQPYASFDELESEFSDVIFKQDRQEIAEQLGLNVVDRQIWETLRLIHSDGLVRAEGDESANGERLSDVLDLFEDSEQALTTVKYMYLMGLVDISGDICEPELCNIRLNPFADSIMKGGDE